MGRINIRIEEIEDAGYEVIREGQKVWVESGASHPKILGDTFSKRFNSVKAAHDQIIKGKGRAKIERPGGQSYLIIDVAYHREWDPREEGSVMAELQTPADVDEYCKLYGYSGPTLSFDPAGNG